MSVFRLSPSLLMAPSPGQSLQNTILNRYPRLGPCQLISDSIWASILVWEGGSMVKRITQNSPTRCSLTPCQLLSSIHPSIVPSLAPSSFHLSFCGYLCLFSSFFPCQEDYIVPLSHVFHTHPPFRSSTTLLPITV